MTNLSLLKTGAAVTIVAAALALTSRVTTASATPAYEAASFAWSGVYDLVGTGFPDGQRNAVMYISKEDKTEWSTVDWQGQIRGARRR